MKKPKVTRVAPTDWENAGPEDVSAWETLPSGFAPLWKPEKGNAIIVLPIGVHAFKNKPAFVSGKKGKKDKEEIAKVNFAIECILRGGDVSNFFNKDEAASVSIGDKVSLGSAHNLIGEDKLIVVDGAMAELSPMSKLLMEDKQAFRIVFNGKIKIANGRSVNNFIIQVPNGYKEKSVKQGNLFN